MGIRPYVSLVGGFAKYLTNVHSSSCTVTGLDRFLQLLADEDRRKGGRGVVTFANHISVIDDPGLWGVMPWSTYQNPHTTRWTLGATDVMFTNPFFSYWFNRGQVISTNRGRGIFQPALDTAISKLDEGQWVHLFPEGYVNLSRRMVLRRFKWGLSRLLLETKKAPRVVPIWIEGFDQMMPDPRNFPRFLPRPFAKLFVHFGEPIDSPHSTLDRLLADLRRRPSLNPRWWQDEAASTDAALASLSGAGCSTHPTQLEAPTIPIPPMSAFPKPDPLPIPPSGWAPPPPGSLAALSLEATQRAQAQAHDGQDPMAARSGLVELLRRELAWLGVKSRSLRRGERSGDEEDLGRLVHRLMPEEDGKDGTKR